MVLNNILSFYIYKRKEKKNKKEFIFF